MATAKRYVWSKYNLGSTSTIETGDRAANAGASLQIASTSSSAYVTICKALTWNEDDELFYPSGTYYIRNISVLGTLKYDEDYEYYYSNSTYSASTYPYLILFSDSASGAGSTAVTASKGDWVIYRTSSSTRAYVYNESTAIYYVTASTTYSQGSTSYGYVTSSTSSTYGTSTSGAKSGSYWYVYQGYENFGIGAAPTFSPETPVAGQAMTISFTPLSNTYGGTITYIYRYQTYDSEDDIPDSVSSSEAATYFPNTISETTGTSVAFTVPDAAYIDIDVQTISDGLGWTGATGYRKYAATYTYTAPTAPDEIAAAGGTYEGLIFTDDTITVTWSASTDADDDLTGYIVQRSYNGGSYTTVYQGSALTCTDTAASTWTTVQYRVQAYDNQGLYSDYTYSDTYAVTANTAPSAPAAVTIPTSIYLDVQHTISWSASTDSEGDAVYYEVAVSYDGGTTWESVTSGITDTSTTATITDASITQVQYRVRAYDTYGACSSWTCSSTRTVINNTSPTITVTVGGTEISSGGDLGTYTDTAPDVTVAIYDADGDTVTVTVTMGSTTLSSAEISGSGTVTVDFGDWQTVTNGTYTLTVTADDGTDTVTWTGSLTKDMSSCSITMTENVTTENTITGVVMSISGSIPDDATVSCLATADGTNWEDVTDYASEASLYAFSTTGKSFNFKLTIERGETTGYVSSVQGVLITEE